MLGIILMSIAILSVTMFSVIMLCVAPVSVYADSLNAKICYAEWLYSDCHSVKTRNAVFVMLCGFILSVIISRVVMPRYIMLSDSILCIFIMSLTMP